MNLVSHLQYRKEFACWEFDVRSAKNCIVLYHDRKYRGKKVRLLNCNKIKAHTFNEFVNHISQRIDIVKPFCVDLKHITFKDYSYVADLMSQFDFKLLMHKTRLPKYNRIIEDAKSRGIKVGFYGKN